MPDLTQSMVAMIFLTWAQYVFRILVCSGIIIACAIGWKKKKNPGFIVIFLSAFLSFLHHLPSIYCRGFYAARRIPAIDYGRAMIRWSYIDYTVLPIASLLLVAGLSILAIRKNPQN